MSTLLKRGKIFSIAILFLVLELIYYNVFYDTALIFLLFLTSLSIGSFFNPNLKLIDKYIVQFSLGFGLVGFLIWISTFYNYNYKSLYLIFSLSLSLYRYQYLLTFFKRIIKMVFIIKNADKLFLFIIFVFLMFYVVLASYPMIPNDAMLKHIIIPSSILNNSHYTYNVIESVVYGDYAILHHMYYLFLMALGGEKALTLFNTFLSIVILLILLRIGMKTCKSKFLAHSISLVYLTTPIIYILSTSALVDLLPCLFIFSAIIILFYFNKSNLPNIYIISFLLGSAFFAKQVAAYFIIPIICFVIAFLFYWCFYQKKIHLYTLSLKILVAGLLFLLPFLPSMLIVFYKTGNPVFPFMNSLFRSEYFQLADFKDIFHNVLGLNINSIISIVFHTSKNIELDDGGLGYFLILLLFAPIAVFLKKNMRLAALLFLIIISYFLSTLLTYNIRYMMTSIILAVLPAAYVLTYFSSLIKNIVLQKMIAYLLLFFLILPNIYFTFSGDNRYWNFNYDMLKSHENLARADVSNVDILSSINKKGVRVLSNNDPFKGMFKGEFYTLLWYNTFLVNKIKNKEVNALEFLKSFDYYLICKAAPESLEEYFSLNNKDLKSALTLVDENERYVLYKINRFYPEKSFLSQNFTQPIIVTASTPRVVPIDVDYIRYKIEMDAEKIDKGESFGRWQINWFDEQGGFIETSLIPFKLKPGKNTYISPEIGNIPQRAKKAGVFLSSHDEKKVLIYSFKLYGVKKGIVDKELEKYDKKWPHLRE